MESPESVNARMQSALRDGNNDQVFRIIGSYRLDYCEAWAGGYELFCSAIRNKNFLLAERLPYYGCKLYCEDSESDPPLHLALQKGNWLVIQMILARGTDVNVRSKTGSSPLDTAVKFDQASTAEALLSELNASVDLSDYNGETPLFTAVKMKSTAFASMLIDYGASVEKTCNQRFTPLHLAALNGDPEMVSLLLTRGAPVNALNHRGETPLCLALQSCSVEVMTLLIKAGGFTPANHQIRWKQSLIRIAVLNTNYKMAERFLKKGMDVDSLSYDGRTALHVTAKNGDRNLCQLLLDNSATVNVSDRNGDTPLHFSSATSYDATELLLSNHADVKIQNQRGLTCLHVAALNGNVKTIELLLKHSADSCAVDENGESALHMAVRSFSFEIAKILLENKAKVNQKSRINLTPIYFAAATGDEDLFNLLLSHGAEIDVDVKRKVEARHSQHITIGKTILHNAVSGDCPSIVKHIVEHCNVVREKFDDLLEVVLILENPNTFIIVEYLLAQEFFNRESILTTSRVTTFGNKKLLDLLLRWGASLNSRDRWGHLPLYTSILCPGPHLLEVILRYTTNLSAKDASSALWLASNSREVASFELLLCSTTEIKLSVEDYWYLLRSSTIVQHSCTCVAGWGSDPDCKACFRLPAVTKSMQHHVVKLEAAGLTSIVTVDELISRYGEYSVEEDPLNTNLFTNTVSQDFRKNCCMEVQAMKNTCVGGSRISFYEILTLPSTELVNFMRNEKILEDIKTDTWREKYPIFENLLSSKLAAAQRLAKLFKDFHTVVCKFFPKLPILCIENVKSCFDFEEMRRVIAIYRYLYLTECKEDTEKK